MSIVLVIGNGFDLALGYDSAYTHYINTYAGADRHHFWPFKTPDNSKFNSDSLHQHFYQYFVSHLDESDRIKWIDIEGELYNYVFSKQNLPISDELVSQDKFSFFMLVQSLYRYLNRHEELKYKYHPPKGEDKCVIQLLQSLSRAKDFKNAYTFNYTDLKERLIKYGKFDNSSLPAITYVHGSLKDSKDYSPNIVLGIGTDYSLPQEYSFMQKINNPNADAGDLAVDLSSCDECLFYGLSMGKIDFEYFQNFFKAVVETPLSKQKKYISIFTKGENMIAQISKNINDMGINIRTLKEHSHFNIIDTYQAEFNDNPHYNTFHNLLNRIAKE